MAQSLAKAIKYIKAPDELLATLRRGSYTSDLVLPSTIFTGTQTVKYQHIDFGSYTLGDYSLANGYAQTEIVATWKDLILTQDKGNSLKIDKFEDEEAMANGIVTYVNRYILDVQAKAVDQYRFNTITGKAGVIYNTVKMTKDLILGEVLKAFAVMSDANINIETGMILYVNPTINQLLGEASIGKGYITVGTWNGSIDTDVVMFNGAKKVVVPSDRLGAGVQFILVHKNAVAAFEKYRETVYFDEIPNYGGRKAQADIGIYHDCFVYDELVKAVYVCKVAQHSFKFDDGLEVATGTMADIKVNEGTSIVLPRNTMVVAGHTFAGWDTDVSADAVVYTDGALVTMGTADVTLYAVWALE